MRSFTPHPVTARSVHCMLLALVVSCAVQDSSLQPLESDDVPESLGAHPVDSTTAAALLARAKDLVRPDTVIQTESRLGVPTFLWTRDAVTPAARARWMTSPAVRPAIAVSRAVLADYAPLYRLADSDVADAVVAHVHDLGTGPILVKFRAQIGGIEIFREELTVVLNRKLEAIAMSGYLTSAATPPARPGALAFQLAASAGAVRAIAHLASIQLDGSHLQPAGARDGYDYFTLAPAAAIVLDEPVRIKKVYFHAPDGLEAAYYIEVMARTGTAPLRRRSIHGDPTATSEAYAYVVSAATGQLLSRKNLTADVAPPGSEADAVMSAATRQLLSSKSLTADVARRGSEADAVDPGGFTYRVWADPVTGIPFDQPAGNTADPKVNPVPDGVQAAFVATNDVTLSNLTFSRHDPWLPAGATETVGNNVDAFLNLFSPDGLGPTGPPTDPAIGDFRAQITAPGQFLHSQIPDGNGALAEGRQGAIQQLFYDINFLHDWYYDSGFDEAAGNAQTNNFGRGGLGNDSIKAQAQDFSGFSNANMSTPADGFRPRMRMYVFPSPANMLDVQAPTALAGKTQIGVFMAGQQTFDVTSSIAVAAFTPSPGCTVTNAAALAAKIAMFDLDNLDGTGCSLLARVIGVQATSAAAILVESFSTPDPDLVFSFTDFVVGLTKPMATVSFNHGQAIRAQLPGATVTARLFRAADRDGAIDQQIVFHEFFHYVSNRLVGNAAGLATKQSAGMGEGWSDFSSMLLTVRQDDTAVASNATFNGVYPLVSYATSGVPFDGTLNQGYYFGIRRYPYSTDMTKNPLTFRHITNGVQLPVGPPVGFGADGANNAEVHNIGEVWATMLWECYAALLRDTQGTAPRLTFQQAQDRMKNYVIGGLKLTPLLPTITEARDAILAVALASDPADYVAFRIAFAKRGAGAHAVSPARQSVDCSGVVEDFGTGPDLSFVSATLDDSTGSCDSDGALDAGEYGKLTVALRNTGTTALSATTASISSLSADVWYPDGPVIAFPPVPVAGTTTASLRVAYLRTVTGIQQLDLRVAFTDAQMTGSQTKTVSFRANIDEIPHATATDTVEATSSPWTLGFAPGLGNAAPWHRTELSLVQHVWHADDPAAPSDQYLISPVMTIDAGSSLNLQFDHSWAFESSGGFNFDGGVVEISVNGGGFTDMDGTAYNGTIAPGGSNPLNGRRGFVATSAGTVHTSLTRAVAAGSTVQIRFRLGADISISAAGWTLDNLAFTGVVETPFASLVPETGSCTKVPVSADLAISVDDGVTQVRAGTSVTYTITATNAGGDDIIGANVADTFSSALSCTWTCTPSAGGTCLPAGTGNIADHIALPAGGVATYTAICAVSTTTPLTQLSNTATIALPGPVTDPVTANNTATDTDTLLRVPSHLFGSKRVTGNFVQGGTVTYAIVIGNDGGKQFDNAGDELTDILPADLRLVSATATAGTAVATPATNTVTWNGDVPSGGSVTISIVATISAAAGTRVSNQASFKYDSDGDAINDATGVTDAFPCPP